MIFKKLLIKYVLLCWSSCVFYFLGAEEGVRATCWLIEPCDRWHTFKLLRQTRITCIKQWEICIKFRMDCGTFTFKCARIIYTCIKYADTDMSLWSPSIIYENSCVLHFHNNSSFSFIHHGIERLHLPSYGEPFDGRIIMSKPRNRVCKP